jgi:predicted dehydrogenase
MIGERKPQKTSTNPVGHVISAAGFLFLFSIEPWESMMSTSTTRRQFLKNAGLGAAILGIGPGVKAVTPANIQGFEESESTSASSAGWKPVSDRKLRVGIIGFGVCQFGAAFSFQDHPNVEIAAVSDLIPDRCQKLAEACRCSKTYPSLEELIKDDSIEAVFIATDAPSHARHCMDALRRGKHVACAVPAVFGNLEDAEELYEAVVDSERTYMMFETSYFHQDLYAMRQIYRAGGLGKIVYAEGEYYHYMPEPIPSFRDWRVGLPPQWYPTHSNAYFVGATGGTFSEVSCMGMPSWIEHLKPGNNRYANPFGTEIALFRTSEGGSARMAVSWDTPGFGGEMGRIRGQKGTFYDQFSGLTQELPDINRPPLPPKVQAGGHGGSHGYLMNEFVTAILENRKPLVDIAQALNMTVAGIVAHQSALRGGELLKIPQYAFI